MIKVYSAVFVDHGFLRSAVVDTQREDYQLIPKELGALIETLRGPGIENRDAIDKDYFNFLEEYELFYEVSPEDVERFVDLDLTWHTSAIISNCVIELGGKTDNLHELIEDTLSNLGCQRVLFVSQNKLEIETIDKVLTYYQESILRSIDIISHHETVDTQKLAEVIKKHPRLRSWVMYNAPEDMQVCIGEEGFGYVVNYSKNFNYRTTESCIDPAYFKANIALYSESQLHHTYFNCKLFIRADAALLNAPASTEVIGYLDENKGNRIDRIIGQAAFKKYWLASKNKTDVCSVCEFRNLCVDSRPPVPRKDGTWYHNTECNYNPFICKWQGEDAYRTLAACNVISNAEGISIDHDRIAEINAELWGGE